MADANYYDRLDEARARTGEAMVGAGKKAGLWNMYMMKKQKEAEKKAKLQRMLGIGGSVIGGVAGGIYGGPMGASMGASAGGALGRVVGGGGDESTLQQGMNPMMQYLAMKQMNDKYGGSNKGYTTGGSGSGTGGGQSYTTPSGANIPNYFSTYYGENGNPIG